MTISRARKFNKEEIRFWHPVAGVNRIRILPNPSKKDNKFWNEVRIHWCKDMADPKDKYISSGSKYRYISCVKDCSICVKYQMEGNKELRPQTKFLFNILDYADCKVKVWMTGKGIFDQISDSSPSVSNICEDLVHPTRGHDLKIVKGSASPFVRLEVTSLPRSRVNYNESELYYLNKVANKLFKVKQAKPKKMLRMLCINTSWK